MDMTLLSAGIDATPATAGASQWNAAVDAMAERTESAMGKIRGSLGSIGSSIASLKTLIAGVSFAGLVKDIMAASQQFDTINNILTATSGSAAMAASQYNELRKTAYQYGQSLPVIARQYAMMTAASRGTSLQGEKVDKIFKAIIVTSTALGLSQDQTQRTMMAVDHMMSKQIVTAQDLRRQFGNNIPGAMAMSAKAMGVTVIEFNKMLKSGTVMAKDLLPKLADEMIKEYQESADRAAGQTRALIGKLQTAWFELEVWIAHSGLGDAFDKSLNRVIDILRSDQFKEAARQFGQLLANGVTIAGNALIFLMTHAKGVLEVLVAIAALKTANFFLVLANNINVAKNALMEFSVVQRAVSGLQGFFTSSGSQAASPVTSAFSSILENSRNKNGLISQKQLDIRMAGKTLSGMSAYDKIQLSQEAAQKGLNIPISALDQYKSAATAPLRAGTAAWTGARSAIGTVGAAITGNKIVSAITKGFQEAGKLKTIESGYGRALPASMQGILNTVTNKLDPSALRGLSGKELADAKIKVDALNFALDKNGKLLNSSALKTRLAGGAYKAMGVESKAAVDEIAVALGAAEAPAIGLGTKLAGGFTGARVGAAVAGQAIRTGFIGAFEAVEGALASNPFTLPVAVILGSIAVVSGALFVLRNNTLSIGDHTAKVGSYIGVVWDEVTQTFTKYWDAAIAGFKSAWTSTVSWFKGIFSGAESWINSLSESPTWKSMEKLLSRFEFMRQWAEKAQQRELAATGSLRGGTARSEINNKNFAQKVGADNVAALSLDGAGSPSYEQLFNQVATTKPQPLGPFSDDGVITKPAKGDPFKEALASQEVLIAKYKDILALDTATKKNQIEINALYAAREKIVELEKGGKTVLTSSQKSQLESAYEQSYALDAKAKAKTSLDEMSLRARTDMTGNQAQIAYLNSVTVGTVNYKVALEDLNAMTKAFDQTRELEGQVSDDALLKVRLLTAADIKAKQAMEDKRGATAEFMATMISATQTAQDQAKVLADLDKAGREGNAGKNSYEPFNRNSPLLNAQSYRYADETLGKSHQKDLLSPDAYSQEREALSNQFKDSDQIKYTQDLINFSKTIKDAAGDLDTLIKQKQKLDDAFKHRYINQGDYSAAIEDLQKNWDKAIDEQLLRANKWEDGVVLGMRSISREAKDTAASVQQAFTTIYQDLENRLTTMLDAGKADFKGFFAGIRHQFDSLLVKQASGSLSDFLLGGASNTRGNKTVGQEGPLGSIAKWLGITKTSTGGLGSPGGKGPVGTSQDPIYVALTTGTDSDFSGLPKKLGGDAANLGTSGSSSGSTAGTVAAITSGANFAQQAASGTASAGSATGFLSSLGNNSFTSTLSDAAKSFGYAGIDSQGAAKHNAYNGGLSGISNVITGGSKAFLQTYLQSLSASSAAKGNLASIIGQSAGYGVDTPASSSISSLLDDGSDDFDWASILGFANGGVMTPKGMMTTYSKGGIANRPQVAQFGEGRTPEAYVPLPDGRTIPVNINGNGATSGGVTVQHETRIYDQTGRGVQTTQSNTMDGEKYVQQIMINDLATEGPITGSLRTYFGQR